jgi:hypothetical protein
MKIEKQIKKDWSVPDEKEMINVPDELEPLFNKIGFQFRFVEFGIKNQVIAVAHVVQAAEEFFTNVEYQRQNNESN